MDGAGEQADGKRAGLFAAKQLPEGNIGEERSASLRPELTASPWAMVELVSLCQHVFRVSSGGLDARVMKSVENKPFLKLPSSTEGHGNSSLCLLKGRLTYFQRSQ